MNNNQEKIFADGMRFNLPRPKAPEYVKGSISIKVDNFINFLQTHAKNGWVNLDLKESKKGVLYLELNTWQKGGTSESQGSEIRKVDQNEGQDDAGYEQSQQEKRVSQYETKAEEDLYF